VFHGAPGDAFVPLEQAAQDAASSGFAEQANRARWLTGVAQGACGLYDSAIETLLPAWERLAPKSSLAPFVAASFASIYRQVSQHAIGQDWDEAGLAHSQGGALAEKESSSHMSVGRAVAASGVPVDEGSFHCLLGLVADAVGQGKVPEAIHRLERAEEALPEDRPWRACVRLDWVRSEVALLRGDAPAACRVAAEAVGLAEEADAPRHVAKGLLFQGVAASQLRDPAAEGLLRRANEMASRLGALPLVWPARFVLGEHLIGLGRPDEGRLLIDRAAEAAREIARDLSGGMLRSWMSGLPETLRPALNPGF